MRAAVFGNVGTVVGFRVGAADAEELAREFAPQAPETLTGLDRGEVCVRTTSSGTTREPFLGRTIGEVGWAYESREKVIEQSRRWWGRRREVVENKLEQWSMYQPFRRAKTKNVDTAQAP